MSFPGFYDDINPDVQTTNRDMITNDEKRKDTSSMLMKVKRKMKGLLSQVKTFWPKEKFYILILRSLNSSSHWTSTNSLCKQSLRGQGGVS